MPRMNGCNDNIKPAGKNSTRMSPVKFARNNLSKGGVNDFMGGTRDKMAQKVGAGGAAQGKHHHMPKGK